MKRKVSMIWVVVLALIAIAACAFAVVTYYRCGKQPELQFPQNELLRILDAGSDAEGVGFEVMRIGGGSVNLRLDLRWKKRFRQGDCLRAGVCAVSNERRCMAKGHARTAG